MKKKDFDLSVYFIADPSVCKGRSVVDIVRTVTDEDGATIVQLRNKSGDKKEFLQQAQACMDVLRPKNIPLIINDDIEIAMSAKADGVHLGQDDFPVEEARVLLGSDAIIGKTAFEGRHFEEIDPDIVDYTGTGPVYPTLTKPDKHVMGIKWFAEMVAMSPVPVVGIGGIVPENASPVIEAGAYGVAMMRAVSEADNPRAVIEQFSDCMTTARLRAKIRSVS